MPSGYLEIVLLNTINHYEQPIHTARNIIYDKINQIKSIWLYNPVPKVTVTVTTAVQYSQVSNQVFLIIIN